MRETFEQRLERQYEIFRQMIPYGELGTKNGEIRISDYKDPALMIDICKSFIDLGNNDYEFSTNYEFFRRIGQWPGE